jgi:hypothetical protein
MELGPNPGGGKFSTPVQTCPVARPAIYTLGTGSFPGVKRLGRGVDHPFPSSTKVNERVELYLYWPMGLYGLFYGELYLYFTFNCTFFTLLIKKMHWKKNIRCMLMDAFKTVIYLNRSYWQISLWAVYQRCKRWSKSFQRVK